MASVEELAFETWAMLRVLGMIGFEEEALTPGFRERVPNKVTAEVVVTTPNGSAAICCGVCAGESTVAAFSAYAETVSRMDKKPFSETKLDILSSTSYSRAFDVIIKLAGHGFQIPSNRFIDDGDLEPLPFYARDDVAKEKTHHRLPRQQTKRVATAIGGRPQPASGAFKGHEGDAIADSAPGFRFLVECKRSSGKRSIRLESSHLTKITSEALGKGSYPALDIEFDASVMASQALAMNLTAADNNWIAVPLSVFRSMIEAIKDGDD